jgi:hypothetical protein
MAQGKLEEVADRDFNDDADEDLDDRMHDRLLEPGDSSGSDNEIEDGGYDGEEGERESADAAVAELDLQDSRGPDTSDVSAQQTTALSTHSESSADAAAASEPRRLSLRKRAPVASAQDNDFEYDVNKAVNGVSSNSGGARSAPGSSGTVGKDNSLFEQMYNDAPPGMPFACIPCV